MVLSSKLSSELFEWWKRQFEDNGLLDRVRASSRELFKFNMGLAQSGDEEGKIYLKSRGIEFILGFCSWGDSGAEFFVHSPCVSEENERKAREDVLRCSKDKDYACCFNQPEVIFGEMKYENIPYKGVIAGAFVKSEYKNSDSERDALFLSARKFFIAPLYKFAVQKTI